MTGRTQSSFTKEEMWVLDLFSAAKDRSISRKVLLGLWESTFPKDGVVGLRSALKSPQEKQILKIAPDGYCPWKNKAERTHERLTLGASTPSGPGFRVAPPSNGFGPM